MTMQYNPIIIIAGHLNRSLDIIRMLINRIHSQLHLIMYEESYYVLGLAAKLPVRCHLNMDAKTDAKQN